MRIFFAIVVFLLLVSCSRTPQIDQIKIKQRCEALEQSCKVDCQDGEFKVCYVDTALFGDKDQYDVRAECHGMHVGSLCKPCNNIFSLNFGGSMRQVSCHDFFEAIEKQNQECGGCIKKVGSSPDVP